MKHGIENQTNTREFEQVVYLCTKYNIDVNKNTKKPYIDLLLVPYHNNGTSLN